MIEHGLPGEGQNAAWFEKLNPFEQQETLRQVRFKRGQLGLVEPGPWPNNPTHCYPHILPADTPQTAVFYDGIAEDVIAYCCTSGVELHSQLLNLRSSQVCCFNVMFPMRENLGLATVALAPLLSGVRRVTGIEFEYTGPPEVTGLLGEPSSGKRGQNRTSIDCAVWWQDQSGGDRLTLVEWKYTERSFGTCGGWASHGNTGKAACRQLDVSEEGFVDHCYLVRRHERKYWDLMESAGIDLRVLSTVKGCPFRGPFYQLMRQYALAGCLRELMPGLQVDVAYAGFRENQGILGVARHLRVLGSTVLEAWHAVVREPLRHVHVEDIVVAASRAGAGANDRWLRYLSERYGL